MGIRFAGSRSLDERRRRRLATENDARNSASETAAEALNQVDDLDQFLAEHLGETEPNEEFSKSDPTGRPVLTIEKIIPQDVRHLWSVGLVGFVLVSVLLAAMAQVSHFAVLLGPGVGQLLSVDSPGIAKFFGSVVLLFSAQISILIWWLRSQSLHDFQAKYRSWLFIACSWLFVAFCQITGAHAVFSHLVINRLKVPLPNQQIWGWVLLVLPFAFLLLRSCHREMRGCRASLSTFWGAVVCCYGALLLQLEPRLLGFWAGRELLSVGLSLFGQVLIFQSLVLHAGHVLYVTTNPAPKPEAKPSKVAAWFGRLAARLPRVQFGKWARKNNDQNLKGFDFEPAVEEEVADSQAAAISPSFAESDAEPESETSAEEAALDPEILKGLSKKERRRLRKQFRDHQRSE